MSKFAPDVPKSLVDAVSAVLGEAKVEPAKPIQRLLLVRKN